MISKTNRTVVEYTASSLFAVTIVGQWAFAAYILLFYAFPAVSGNVDVWNRNSLLAHPPVESGKIIATFAFGSHAIGASIIALFGGLQIIPSVRNRWRALHRWNGRIFIFTVVGLSISGFYLTWVRGPMPDSLSDLGTSVNGVLILTFAALTVISARNRRFMQHERWAIRLFLVSNAQWFLRIGGFGYFVVAQSLGVEVAFDGWFFKFWTWGCFIVPIAVSEVYFISRRSKSQPLRWLSASLFAPLIPLTLIGIGSFSFYTIQIIQAAA